MLGPFKEAREAEAPNVVEVNLIDEHDACHSQKKTEKFVLQFVCKLIKFKLYICKENQAIRRE